MGRVQYAIILILIMVLQCITISSEVSSASEIIEIEAYNYTEASTLAINSDQDLVGLSLPGNGTEVNPYIFSGYNFTSTELNQLIISNTSKHIEISDNIFRGLSSEQIGISLYNVSNIKIVNNSMSDLAIGITANFTGNYNISIDNNTISDLNSDDFAAGIHLYGWCNISSISGNYLNNIYSENSAFGMKLNSTQLIIIDTLERNTILQLNGVISHGIAVYAHMGGVTEIINILHNRINSIESSEFSSGIYFEHIRENIYITPRHGAYVDVTLMQYNNFYWIISDGRSMGVYHSFNVRVSSVLNNSFLFIGGTGYYYGCLNADFGTASISLTKFQGNYFYNNGKGLTLNYHTNFDFSQNLDISDNLFVSNGYGLIIDADESKTERATVLIEGSLLIHRNDFMKSQSYAIKLDSNWDTGDISGDLPLNIENLLIYHNNLIENNPAGKSQIWEYAIFIVDVRFNYYSDHSLVDIDPQDFIIDMAYHLDSVKTDRYDLYPTAILNPNDITFNPIPIFTSSDPDNKNIIDITEKSTLQIGWEKELGYNLNPFYYNIKKRYLGTSDWVNIGVNITSKSYLWTVNEIEIGFYHLKIIAIENGTGSAVESDEILIEFINSALVEVPREWGKYLIIGTSVLSMVILAVVILYRRNKRLKTDLAVQKDPKLKQAKLKEYAKEAKDIIERDN
jgi:hypothetical protein